MAKRKKQEQEERPRVPPYLLVKMNQLGQAHLWEGMTRVKLLALFEKYGYRPDGPGLPNVPEGTIDVMIREARQGFPDYERYTQHAQALGGGRVIKKPSRRDKLAAIFRAPGAPGMSEELMRHFLSEANAPAIDGDWRRVPDSVIDDLIRRVNEVVQAA